MTAAGDGVEKPSFLARWTKVINEAPRRGPAVEDSPAATDIVERLRDEASGQRAAFSMGIDAPAVCPITLDAAADLIDRLRAEIDHLRAGIQAMLDGNYPHPRAHRPGDCPHGTPYYQECAQCDTAWLQALLDPREAALTEIARITQEDGLYE